MSIINNICGTSLLSSCINVPNEFGINVLSTTDKSLVLDTNFNIAVDTSNISSILELETIPYIDFSKYDYERRRWFKIDRYGSLWRHYIKGDYIIEQNAIYDEQYHYIQSDEFSGVYFSLENLFKSSISHSSYDYLDYNELAHRVYIKDELGIIVNNINYGIISYKPVTLIIEGEEYKDITDYSYNVHPELDYIAPKFNKQFYIKDNKIYTNTDLTLYATQNISLTYHHTISDVRVHCEMSTNSDNYSNYTPVVDYYLLKLTGQTL